MNDMVEGIGSAIEGGLVGQAVEPDREGTVAAKGDRIGLAHPAACANCGATASANYCPECGQKTHVHRSLSAIGHDLVHGVLHLDGKFWRTLPMLAARPGRLTRRYIDGERASFVSPMAMFLFSVFAMFAVFQIVGIGVPTEIGMSGGEQTAIEINQELGELERERVQLQRTLNDPETDEDRTEIAARIDEVDAELASLAGAKRVIEALQDNTPATEEDNTASSQSAQGEHGKSDDFVVAFLEKQITKWRHNPGLMLYKLQANAYKFSWLLIPLSLPFVWLLFAWRRDLRAYDHTIFVTYSLAFMSLLFIALSLVGALGVPAPWLAILGIIIPPVHIYKQLRSTYSLSRPSTIWRLLVLLPLTVVVATLFVQVLVLLGTF